MDWTFIGSGFTSINGGTIVTHANLGDYTWQDFESTDSYSVALDNPLTFLWKFSVPDAEVKFGINTGTDKIEVQTGLLTGKYDVSVNDVSFGTFSTDTISLDVFAWVYNGITAVLYRNFIPIWNNAFSSSSVTVYGSMFSSGEINSFSLSQTGGDSGSGSGSGGSGGGGGGGGAGYDGHLNYGSDTYHREGVFVEAGYVDYSNHQGVITPATYRNLDRAIYPGYENYSGSVIDIPGSIVAAKNAIKATTAEAYTNPNVTPSSDDSNALSSVFTRYGLNKNDASDQKTAVKLMQFESSNLADKMMTGQMLGTLGPIDYALAQLTYVIKLPAAQDLKRGQVVGIVDMPMYSKKMAWLAGATTLEDPYSGDTCFMKQVDGIVQEDCLKNGMANILLMGFFTYKLEEPYPPPYPYEPGLRYYLGRIAGTMVEQTYSNIFIADWKSTLNDFDPNGLPTYGEGGGSGTYVGSTGNPQEYGLGSYILQDIGVAVSKTTLFFHPSVPTILHPEWYYDRIGYTGE